MGNEEKYDCLKLDRQLCFPLYAAARKVIGRYHGLLSALDLTYTQYVTMMVLWEEKSMSVKELGARLYLDSGTLTPLLKVLEKKGYVDRRRSEKDERVVNVTLTGKGEALKEEAARVPGEVSACVKLPREDAERLYVLSYKLLDALDEGKEGKNNV